MKRLLDFAAALTGLVAFAPVLLVVMLLVWLQDRHSPLYIAPRVGHGGLNFNMVKIRSMIVGADKTGVESTSASDRRVTRLGQFIRRYKLDELSQLWNVLLGEMSLVGPRPNTRAGVDVYTDAEWRLLSVRPGITDFASIVFSDEGEILRDQDDPDLAYDQLIRPWKSRLGLAYIDNQSIFLDIRLIIYTVVAILSRETALKQLVSCLKRLGVDAEVVSVAERRLPLQPSQPPGSKGTPA